MKIFYNENFQIYGKLFFMVLGGGCTIFMLCLPLYICTLTSGSSDCDTFSHTHGTRINAPTILHR